MACQRDRCCHFLQFFFRRRRRNGAFLKGIISTNRSKIKSLLICLYTKDFHLRSFQYFKGTFPSCSVASKARSWSNWLWRFFPALFKFLAHMTLMHKKTTHRDVRVASEKIYDKVLRSLLLWMQSQTSHITTLSYTARCIKKTILNKKFKRLYKPRNPIPSSIASSSNFDFLSLQSLQFTPYNLLPRNLLFEKEGYLERKTSVRFKFDGD